MMEMRLTDLLQSKGKTYYWLASQSGVTYQTLHKFKTGKAKAITFEVLEKICRALGCGPGDLLVIENEKAKQKGKRQK